MYVRHPPSEHNDWANQKKSGQKYTPPDYRPGWKSDGASIPPPNNETGNDKSDTPRSKLVLKDSLKQVLTTKLMLSDEDVDQLIAVSER